MPYKSDAQRKAMHAAAAGHSTIGIPQAAAQSFVSHSHGESAANLPEHVPKRKLKGKRKSKRRKPDPREGTRADALEDAGKY